MIGIIFAILLLQDDAQEEFGWKLVHGDVFRPPGKGMLLSVMLGTGTQVVIMTSITLGKVHFFNFLTERNKSLCGYLFR